MAKKLVRVSKIEFIGGQAKPGPQLASLGIDMGKFTKEFNDKTKDRKNEVVPAIINAYSDRSFSFVLKTTPTANLIKEKIDLKKGSSKPKSEKIGKISMKQIREIAEYKLKDLNTSDIGAAIKIIIGSVHSLGVEIEGQERPIDSQNLVKDENK